MASVQTEQKLGASAETVWTTIGGFCALGEWHPAVAKLEPEDGGKVRRLSLPDGAQIVERLEAHDDAARSYSYTIVESPLPVADYHSTIKVVADGTRCTVQWSGHCQASGASDAEVEGIVTGIYRAGLDALKARFG